MSSAFAKATTRTFLHNKGRFLANFLTVFFAVALTGGLGALPKTFAESFSQNYIEGNAPDLIVKSKAYTGFSHEDIEAISHEQNVTAANAFFTVDAKEDDGTYNRFYIYDFQTQNIAKPKLLNGKMPVESGQVLVEKGTSNRTTYPVGTSIHITTQSLALFAPSDLTVVGVTDSTLYTSVAKERANLEDENDKQYIKSVFYIERATIPEFAKDMEMYTDIYVRLNVAHDYFSDEYKNAVRSIKDALLYKYGENRIAVLTLDENTSYALFHEYTNKVQTIGYIFPFFFLLVCALINHITITRLIKDEHSLLGTYSSIGISERKLIGKYALFIGLSVSLGALFGYFVGVPALPPVVYNAYNAVFNMQGCPLSFLSPIAIVASFVLILLALGIGIYSAASYLKEQPSELMRDKAPKAGKKILLEHIPFLWNRFPFIIKSSLRNIFRQKKNFFLTTLSIIGSTLLVLIGFALLNVSNALQHDELFSEVASSMGLISAVIIAFALLMSAPVLYALASMNVADRKRELATLKVLGYSDGQCLNYTFREVFMISVLAVLLGLPISALIIHFVLNYLAFGSLKDVQWWSYLATAGIILISMTGINYLLYPRIRAIDMSDSLKANE